MLQTEALNALAFVLLNLPVDSTDGLWKTILKTQHHDVYCFCAPELKGKAIGWLRQVEQDAEAMARRVMSAIASQIKSEEDDEQAVVVFNTTPHPQTNVVTLDVPFENPIIANMQGDIVPSDSVSTANGSAHIRFLADANGLGYETYLVRDGGVAATETSQSEPFTFENDDYRATVQLDGTFTSLILKSLDTELLSTEAIHGNQLAAMDSTGLSPWRPGMAPREDWQPPQAGPQLNWQPTELPQVRPSSLGTVVSLNGQMGDKITGHLRLAFYHNLPRIDLSWTFTFDTATIGTFYDDDSKLRVQWPLAFEGDIQHDIAFGAIKTRTEWPFFPANWVDISDGEKGLAYFHQGTPKHWVTEDEVLVNLFAWGEDTEAIGSRMWRYNWPKAFDQRLRGQHTIHSALYPHSGDWRKANVIGAARSFSTPPVAYLSDGLGGDLPSRLEVLTLTDPEIAATAVKVEDEQAVCRLYSVGQEPISAEAMTQNLQPQALHSLAGEPIAQLAPFQIGELVLV